jgi:hypothetical protein
MVRYAFRLELEGMVSGAASYKVKYRINNTSTWSYKNVSSPTTSALLNNLQSGTTYQWKVKTFCSPTSNYSSYSGNNLFGTSSFQGGQQSRVSQSTQWSEINVFPNPTSGKVTVVLGNSDPAVITVRNVHGQLVYRESVANEVRLDVEIEGASGLYSIEVMTNNGQSEVFRVLKE